MRAPGIAGVKCFHTAIGEGNSADLRLNALILSEKVRLQIGYAVGYKVGATGAVVVNVIVL